MRIFVKVRPGAKREEVSEKDPAHFVVSVHAPAAGGKANQAALAALAEHFDVGISRVRLIRGHARRQKIIEIL